MSKSYATNILNAFGTTVKCSILGVICLTGN